MPLRYKLVLYLLENFKYIKNISEDEGTILIYRQIGNSMDSNGNMVCGVNGADFANEMKYLERVCNKITVRINSPGGNVLDGYSIASSILNCKKPVQTVIDGLAASTAGWCAACGTPGMRDIMDYGSFMAHGSSGGNDKEMENFVDATINTVLAGRSGKKPEDIADMMKKETWMNATEAKQAGFVDNIISSKIKVKMPKNSSAETMASIYNKLINKPNMEKVNAVLKLKNEASEDSAVSAIEALNTEIAALKAENATLKASAEAKAVAEKEALKNKATALVNKAEADKKISKEEVPGLIELAISNYSTVETMLSKIGTASNQTAAKVFDVKNVQTAGGGEDRSAWTVRDWEKKDPKGLGEMKNTTPELYNALYNKFYKKD